MTTTEHVPGQLDLDGALPLSPAEAATVDRFDETPDAHESLRWRVAAALYGGWFGRAAGHLADEPEGMRDVFLAQADAALAVVLEDGRR